MRDVNKVEKQLLLSILRQNRSERLKRTLRGNSFNRIITKSDITDPINYKEKQYSSGDFSLDESR